MARPGSIALHRGVGGKFFFLLAILTTCLGLACDGGGPIVIDSVDPQTLPYRTGGELTVHGHGFEGTLEVSVGGVVYPVVSQEATKVRVRVDGRTSGGRAAINVRSEYDEARFDGFVFAGIPVDELAWVQARTATEPDVNRVLHVAEIDLEDQPAVEVIVARDAGVESLLWSNEAWSKRWRLEREDSPLRALAVCTTDVNADGQRDLLVGAPDTAAGAWIADPSGTPQDPDLPAPTDGEGSDGQMPDGETPVDEFVEPITAVCADLDGDGVPSMLYAANSESGPILLAASTPDWSPTSSSARTLAELPSPVGSILVEDVDQDGALDVLVVPDDGAPILYLGDGDGGLARAPIGMIPQFDVGGAQVIASDLAGDEAPELIFASPRGLRVWTRAGETFRDVSHEVAGADVRATNSIHPVDVDRDGATDLVALDGDGAIQVLRNDGSGRLFDYTATAIRVAWVPARAISSADVDLDHDDDLLVLTADGSMRTWLNWPPLPAADADQDGIPDAADVCPDEPDPEQRNDDAHPLSCPDESSCEAGAGCELLRADGNHYLLCAGQPMSWDDASSFCARRGTHLLRLETADEQVALGPLVDTRVWLDLTDRYQEGAFVWSDGSALQYDSWAEGEPNDSGEGEDCAEMAGNATSEPTWNDRACSAQLAFVCEEPVGVREFDPGNACDVCPLLPNPDQLDNDDDGVGDACSDGGGAQ